MASGEVRVAIAMGAMCLDKGQLLRLERERLHQMIVSAPDGR